MAIMDQIEKHNVLSEAQHGFRRKRGTHTANLQIKNALETAWQHMKQIFGSSWDISKAFDSVGRPLIRLAWERVGASDEIVDWLVELDRDNHIVVRSTWVSRMRFVFENT